MKPKLSPLENLYLSLMAALLAVMIVLGNYLMLRIARFEARKLREAERDALIRDVETWLEVQRGQTA